MFRNPDLPRKKYVYFYIYIVTNLLNNKQYIGQHASNDESDSYYGSGKILERSIKKYGKNNFKREIIQYCDYEMELDECEIYWIKELNTKVPNGYNLTDGGEGGRGMIISMRVRKKQSEMMKGNKIWLGKHHTKESNQKNRVKHLGKITSPETRQKISKANMGKKRSEEFKLNDALHKMGDLNPAKTPETRIKISKKLKGKFMGEINPMAKSSRKRKNLEELKNKGIILKGDTHEYLRKKIKCINIETQDILFFDGVQDLLKTLKINKRKYYAHLKDKQPILNKWICELLN
jgi:group I intron endonuclease